MGFNKHFQPTQPCRNTHTHTLSGYSMPTDGHRSYPPQSDSLGTNNNHPCINKPIAARETFITHINTLHPTRSPALRDQNILGLVGGH